ncbi:MAG TPA: cytidine deaminase [Candidatus Thermoplasmatota archaeon]
MGLNQRLVDSATALLEERFPEGEGVAAALYTDDGQILTSVYFDPNGGVAGLCAETGALLEAHKLGKRVAAIACVARKGAHEAPVVLTPCGVCQERLVHWGYDVEVAVPDPADPTRWLAKRLHEVQPYHWRKVKRAKAP